MEDKTVEKEQKPKKRKSVSKEGKDPNVCMKTESCIYGGRSGGLSLCDYLAVQVIDAPALYRDALNMRKRNAKERRPWHRLMTWDAKEKRYG